MANLPLELIREIMLWSPVRSLLRFRCVCKSLCAVIDSKSFINSHFKRCSSENGIHRKLIYRERIPVDQYNVGKEFRTFNINDGSSEKFLHEVLLPSSNSMYHLFVAYCNGLVLLRLTSHKFLIWNPSTRKHRFLPLFPVKYPNYRVPTWNLALGYDSTVDDYKVVVMTSLNYFDIPKVWVFGLKSKSWRKLEDFPYGEYFDVRVGGDGDCFADGALHYVCYNKDMQSHIVVAFDVEKETFSVVLEPVAHSPTPKRFLIRLHAVIGCLCIDIFDYETEKIELYHRKNTGVEFIWTKLYSVPEEQFIEEGFFAITNGKVLEYSEEGGKVLLCYSQLYLYDIKERSIQVIKWKHPDVLDYIFCIESLESVGS